MSRKKLVFEIGVEEIPSQYVDTMAKSLYDNARAMLTELRLEYSDMKVMHTPRRLVLMVNELSDNQNAMKNVVKGPARKVAFLEDGVTPSKALEGFLRKNKKNLEDIEWVNDAKAEYATLNIVSLGDNTKDVLVEALPKLIGSIYNPNPMRWGSYIMKFIRPIRWIMAVFGEDVVEAVIECTKASNLTYGHRTLANCEVCISSADEYLKVLKDAFVIVDQNERKQQIVDQIKDIEKQNGFKVEIDEALLDEVNNIVEYPTCAVGHFDEKYLELPECVIKEPLKVQQRYFPVYFDSKITNSFVYTRNGGSDFIDNVTRGNERVLRPRLEDAEFFYNNDLKSSLEEKAGKLADVVFVEKGGSYLDKAKRVFEISKVLAEKVKYDDIEQLEKVAFVMKADLVSSVVREYTNTQGIAGAVFAEKEGYSNEVCLAIKEQYLPNYRGDSLPSNVLSAITAIADKLDTVMCLSSVGLKPSGSDPYGLRRQTLGIFAIALDRGFDIDLDKLIIDVAPMYESNLVDEDIVEFVKFIQGFFYQRLRVLLHDEKGYSIEVLDKVSISDLNIYKSVKKINIIDEIGDTQWYIDFTQIFNRIVKLIKYVKNEDAIFDKSIVDEAARDMFYAFANSEAIIAEKINEELYEDAIKMIAECGKRINSFMDNNMALCDNIQLRNNRIAFFKRFCDVCSEIIQI